MTENSPVSLCRCDLHVHSRYSTDSGNYALRRARLAESLTEPERVYEVSRSRGMGLVTISDHNTLEGALRIAHLPGTFLSEEVTTRFPEDDVPLHVLVWNLTEEDHRDLQEYRPSVYDLTAFLRSRGLVHALAHPLYRMGAPLTAWHVERMMLLFSLWEGRNGARQRASNDMACKLALAATPDYVAALAERHGIDSTHQGAIGLTGGSDDHGALDIATTWTAAPGESVDEVMSAIAAGRCRPQGAHGSTLKLAHAAGGLFLRHWYQRSGSLPTPSLNALVETLERDAEDADLQHEEISASAISIAKELVVDGLIGEADGEGIAELGGRIGLVLLAGAVELPYLASARHHADSQAGLRDIEASFFDPPLRQRQPRALVFTDTFEETNGVARTMQVLARRAEADDLPIVLAVSGDIDHPSVRRLAPQFDIPLPAYESIPLRFPSPADAIALAERVDPDVIHVATPGPVGACGLLAAKMLGLPLVGSWHTELAPFALHLTRDLLVAQATEMYVDAFYRQCDAVLAPTAVVAGALESRGMRGDVGIWGRGVDADLFTPARRSEEVRRRLLADGSLLLLAVGRVSREKRLETLLDAFSQAREGEPGLRLVVVGDGPAREELEATAPEGVTFAGELNGTELAAAYAGADVFCSSSTTDTFGQVLLEAAASGLPVVAAAAGGAPELVSHQTTGLLVPPDDAGAMAEAILLLARDNTFRGELGRQGRRDALGWSWERSIEQLLAAYRNVVRRPPPKSARSAA
jgi:glycosyltransferase involved in cell wall biosynthesis